MAYRKYGNRKTVVDGKTFDSQREAKRYSELKLLERAGEIEYLELQPKVKIVIGGVPIKFDSGRQMSYIADFRYYDRKLGEYVVEDSKGYKTPIYKIKKALVKAMGIEIVET